MISEQNIQDTFFEENWTTVPKLKVLSITDSKLTTFVGLFGTLEKLTLTSNKPFRLSASTMNELPSALVELAADLDGKLSATDFQNLKKLKKLSINPYADVDYKIFSGLQSLQELYVQYKTPTSHILNITIEACPASLSLFSIDAQQLGSLENRCSNISELTLSTGVACDSDLNCKLLTQVGEYRNPISYFSMSVWSVCLFVRVFLGNF